MDVLTAVDPAFDENQGLLISEAVDEHLTKSSEDVRDERKAAADKVVEEGGEASTDPLIVGLSIAGKIRRDDLIRLRFGDKNCVVDLTGADSFDEVDAEVNKRFNHTITQEGYKDPDTGKMGSFDYAGSNDYHRICDVSTDPNYIVPEGGEFKAYESIEEEKDDTLISPDRLSGVLYRPQKLDVDIDSETGKYERATDDGKVRKHVVNGLEIVDGEVQNQRNIYTYIADANILMDAQSRKALPQGKGQKIDDADGKSKVWIPNGRNAWR